jgi:hypothetical protein
MRTRQNSFPAPPPRSFFPILAHVLALLAVAPLVWVLISVLKPA